MPASSNAFIATMTFTVHPTSLADYIPNKTLHFALFDFFQTRKQWKAIDITAIRLFTSDSRSTNVMMDSTPYASANKRQLIYTARVVLLN